jgi:carbon storage regulator
MLVFTRKRDEAIMIGDGVEIRILRVGKDGVRIGVSAPPSVSVHRREVYDQIREENVNAARAVTGLEGLAAQLRRRLDPGTPADEATAAAPVAEPHAAGRRR